VRQTKLASSLVNFRAHYKIVGLYFTTKLGIIPSRRSKTRLGKSKTYSAIPKSLKKPRRNFGATGIAYRQCSVIGWHMTENEADRCY